MQVEANQAPYYSGSIPLDKQGYVVSFDINDFDAEKVAAFYAEYGLVVFDNILTQKQIDESISNLWDQVEVMTLQHAKRNDVNTWKHFEYQPELHYYGFVGRKPLDLPQIWKNRSNPLLYKAFKRLYQISSGETINEPMLCLFDRGSLIRPGGMNPEWKLQPLPHFDINPWWWTKTKEIEEFQWRSENEYGTRFKNWLGQGNAIPKVRNFTKLQGVLALSNTNVQTGGFEAVCGFHRHIERWCKDTPVGTYIGDCEDLMAHMQKIYQRAGSVIIFSRELPHGIFANVSQKEVRYAQYTRMAPESTLMLLPQQKEIRCRQVRSMVPKQFLDSKDPICRELFMLDEKL